jgi:hypothetical protein
MTTAEKLLLAQTIILFLTAVAIVWYTYETHKIRKETSKQQLILAEQLVLLQTKEKHDLEKEIALAQPIFRSSGGSWHDEGGYFEFKNHGESAKDVCFESKSDIEATMRPASLLPTGHKLRIDIQEMPRSRPQKFPFVLRYTDKFGNPHAANFEYDFEKALMKEL